MTKKSRAHFDEVKRRVLREGARRPCDVKLSVNQAVALKFLAQGVTFEDPEMKEDLKEALAALNAALGVP